MHACEDMESILSRDSIDLYLLELQNYNLVVALLVEPHPSCGCLSPPVVDLCSSVTPKTPNQQEERKAPSENRRLLHSFT